ncbi:MULTISPECIES: flavin-containing monooxygenase [unclassified Rhodococcus (in: high G+C Gram-positive bacteria)]|uniref:flavin-containing monooxygenase n=1 Tax=unclassified Rhodococcus (in: high G+C Gram-positive bacteria) TaxID=192944 RepID=UPI000AD6F69B|nr:NAD(P)/FAD-dependent oxidoreductase [Rhodococcus sp. M8]
MSTKTPSVDAVVVGAGVAGLYAVHTLREHGLTVQGYESAAGVGGTWYHNRYPGSRCDIESVDYSFSFSEELQQEWTWSERFATQPEILAYLEYVADRFDLQRSFQFSTRVESAVYDEVAALWRVRTDDGAETSARFCLFATGCLSATNVPEIPGRDDFAGEAYHTGQWPHEGVDFRGKRVGVIGTGSSGIQSIPLIAEEADHLFVFQRTANYSIPAGNRLFDEETMYRIKADYAERRRQAKQSGGGSPFTPHPKSALEVDESERTRVYDEWWQRGGVLFSKAFPDQLTNLEANDTARVYWERKIREIVRDPALVDKLVPTDHPIGTKRIVTDSGYYETFNRDDVTLVDLRETPIDRITDRGVATTGGHFDLDVIVYATGFDAMTGALHRIDIRGRHGRTLREEWAAGPRTYLGLGVHGFPNLFIVTGPGSPGPLANMVLASEQHLDWITRCITYLDRHGVQTIEPSVDAVDAWVAECNERAAETLFPSANSWYMGANIPGKPRVFMPFIGGFAVYGQILDDVADAGYKGFVLDGAERSSTPTETAAV